MVQWTRSLLTLLVFVVPFSGWAAPSTYVIVGIAGYGTKKAANSKLDTNEAAPKSEPSGVWTNLPEKEFSGKDIADRIASTVYLEHDSNSTDIPAILSMFTSGGSTCRADLGLIVIVNSWGAKKSGALAKAYARVCGRTPDLFIMIDGISKPIPSPYSATIRAGHCLNYYEINSTVHGGPLKGCNNFQIYPKSHGGIARDHIDSEWAGSDRAQKAVIEFLRNGDQGIQAFVAGETDYSGR